MASGACLQGGAHQDGGRWRRRNFFTLNDDLRWRGADDDRDHPGDRDKGCSRIGHMGSSRKVPVNERCADGVGVRGDDVPTSTGSCERKRLRIVDGQWIH